MAKALTFKEVAFGGFAVGVVGLALGLPGFLGGYNEYKICQMGVCYHQAYSWQEPQPQKLEPVARYIGEPMTKVFGMALAVIGFPVAAWASREQAQICEFDSTQEAIAARAAIQSEMQHHAIDTKIAAEEYEAKKAIESADAIDRFQELFFQSVTMDDIEALVEVEQQKLQQVQNYKTLEFDVHSEPLNCSVEPLNQPTDKDYSDSEQRFYTPLKLTRSQAISIIDQLRTELNQTQLIERLWQVKKGGSAAWKQAHTEFKELMGDFENEQT